MSHAHSIGANSKTATELCLCLLSSHEVFIDAMNAMLSTGFINVLQGWGQVCPFHTSTPWPI